MGRNSFMMVKIRRAFEHAHQLLTVAVADTNQPSYLSFVIRPDDPALADRPGPELHDARSNSEALRKSNDNEADDDDDDGDEKEDSK